MSNKFGLEITALILALIGLVFFAPKIFAGVMVLVVISGLGYLWSKRNDKDYCTDKDTYI